MKSLCIPNEEQKDFDLKTWYFPNDIPRKVSSEMFTMSHVDLVFLS